MGTSRAPERASQRVRCESRTGCPTTYCTYDYLGLWARAAHDERSLALHASFTVDRGLRAEICFFSPRLPRKKRKMISRLNPFSTTTRAQTILVNPLLVYHRRLHLASLSSPTVSQVECSTCRVQRVALDPKASADNPAGLAVLAPKRLSSLQ